MKNSVVITFLLILLAPLQLQAHSADKQSIIEISLPADGALLTNPVTLRFNAQRIDIAAVGVKKHKTGHVLLLINSPIPNIEEPIPMDAHHLHFVNGERDALINLPSGENRLQVMLLDEEHELFEDWLISEPITVTVKPGAE